MTFTWKSPAEGVIDARKEVGGVLLVLRGENLRKERTGLHAKVTVALARDAEAKTATPMGGNTFNLERDSERHDLANALYGTRQRKGTFSDELQKAYQQKDFEADLFDFAEQCWMELLGNLKGGLVEGDDELTEPGFLLDGYVLEEGGTILYAPPKSAKSYTAMLITVAIDAGVPIFGANVRQSTGLYINLERGEGSMRRRLGLVNRVLGLDPRRPLLMLNRRGRTMADVYDAAKEMITEHHVGFATLDSLTRGGYGNLNGNEEANKSMDYLNRLIPSWVAIGHTPRADDSHIFGSIMFDAAMDIGINVRRQRLPDGTLGIGLSVKDTNDTVVPPMRIYAYEFTRFGLNSVREANPGEFPEIEDSVPTSPRAPWERIETFLRLHQPASKTRIADNLEMNKGTVSKEIDRAVLNGKAQRVARKGREILYGLKVAGNVDGNNGNYTTTPKGGGVPGNLREVDEDEYE